MTKRMLIDATHKEEIRVAITDNKKLIEYDYESQSRKPLKGNVFLAKVTRVEPSLQAAFVNFGGNRHGFLPFSEIHPDYFKIPVADREALMAEQEALLQEHDDEELTEDTQENSEEDDAEEEPDEPEEVGGGIEIAEDETKTENKDTAEEKNEDVPTAKDEIENTTSEDNGTVSSDENDISDPKNTATENNKENKRGGRRGYYRGRGGKRAQYRNRNIEVVGGEEVDPEQKFRFNLRRKYKIQEVIKRGQIMLVQVNKEERGNKGAAVGSYLSLPGRYCVLMPNSPRAGGVSRKIDNHKDRARMRDIVKSLEVPKGMSVIVRTAGVARTKAEIRRDLDYLMRLWNNIRELTLQSTAPALVYEEADLIKRSVRDLYTRDIEEIHVAGEEGYKTTKNFMKMMIPSHVKKVKHYNDEQLPLFNRYQVESQINDIGQPEVRLKSGGYLVINPTEALVSIDVNSGKATKGRHIEETALKTNLEAAEEIARQLKLRDLGGLVVIDFIDMEDRRNNAKVERRMKEHLSPDRARVQVGRISSFGLMELSRQRLSSSLTEAQFERCSHCNGMGMVRTADAMSILVLRAIEEEGMRGRAAQIIVQVTNTVALYILNHKRSKLAQIEERYNLDVLLRVNDDISASDYLVEVSKPAQDQENSDTAKNTNTKKSSSSNDDTDEKPSNRRNRRPRRNRQESDQENNVQNITIDASSENKEEPAHEKKDVSKAAKADHANDEKANKKPVQKKAPQKKETNTEIKKPQKILSDGKKDTEKKTAPKTIEKTEPAVARQYETVNEAPKQKKKGWWNRLVE